MSLPVSDRSTQPPTADGNRVSHFIHALLHVLSLRSLTFPVLAAAILMLLGAIWAGWVRIGWAWPIVQPKLAGAHGPLMVSGFLGALISLERAVALRRIWGYAAPLLTGFGGVLLLAGVSGPFPALLLLAGSLSLVGTFAWIVRRQPAVYTRVMAGGAAAWAVGNFLWLAGWPVYRLVLWWAAFLILTIAGERLEMGRLARHTPRIERLFLLAAGIFTGGLLATLFLPDLGVRWTALGMLALAAWLLRYDIARFTVHRPGLPRFAAVSLLSGYFWLAAGGVIGLLYGGVPAGLHYDAFLHAVFLGFVISMIFAHAPIIFPAILGFPITFNRLFYLPLAWLHGSLLLRVAGDLLVLPGLRAWGGLLNGIAILLFLAINARAVLTGRATARAQGRTAPPPAVPLDASTPVAGEKNLLYFDADLYARWRGPQGAPALSRLLFPAALVMFLVAGLTGSLMRLWMWQGFPAGVNFGNVRHAHSHLMYFSWVTPALMALIAARLPAFIGRPAPRSLSISAAASLILGLASYPPFFLWGYSPVQVGAARVPAAVIFSSLNILAWYAFALDYRRAIRSVRRTRPLKLWGYAIGFLLAASAGAWGRAVLVALKVEDVFLTTGAVHLFLDLFSNGWAVLALLGLAYAARPRLIESISGWEDTLLLFGLPFSFVLGLPVDLVPPDLRTLAGLGGLLAAGGLLLHVRALWPHFKSAVGTGWRAPLAFLALAAIMQAGASIAPLARWGEQAGLRILYLHVLLLGFTTLGLLAAWDEHSSRLKWMAGAAAALLVSLLPLTGLWPTQLAGAWRLAAAFLFSFGPPLAAAGWLWPTRSAFTRRSRS